MNKLPVMSHLERIERRDEKHLSVLTFLSSYEVYSTVSTIAMLLAASESSARRTLNQLLKAGLIMVESHFVEGHKTLVFGITQAGLIAADASPQAPYFEKKRIHGASILHKSQTQIIRIKSEKFYGTWTAERQIRIQMPKMKKYQTQYTIFF